MSCALINIKPSSTQGKKKKAKKKKTYDLGF